MSLDKIEVAAADAVSLAGACKSDPKRARCLTGELGKCECAETARVAVRSAFGGLREEIAKLGRAITGPAERNHSRIKEIVINALTMNSSPTIDMGDSHGARGQPGFITYENHYGHVAADILRGLSEMK